MTDFGIKSLTGTERAKNGSNWLKYKETELLAVSEEAVDTYEIPFFRLLIVFK